MAVLHPNPLSVKFLTGVIESRPDRETWRQEYIGLSLLPQRSVNGYELTWDVIQSENGLAGLYAINGRPVPGSDMLFEQKYAEVKNIMSARVLHPTDVMILREPGEIAHTKTGRNMREASQRKLRDAISWCDDVVDATVEYMIMRSLQGSIAWPPKDADGNAISTGMPEWGNVSITINYPLRTEFQQAATTLVGYQSRSGAGYAWTDEDNSKPMKDLEVIAQYILETTGLDAHNSTIVMGGEIMSYLAFNADFLAWIKGTEYAVGRGFIDPAAVKDYIQTKVGYKLKLYNARWTYRTNVGSTDGPTVNSVPFLDRGKILIIPNRSTPGYFATAPSPDGKYNPGKYTWMVSENEPPWETRVGEGLVGLPVPEYYDSIFLFDAFS